MLQNRLTGSKNTLIQEPAVSKVFEFESNTKPPNAKVNSQPPQTNSEVSVPLSKVKLTYAN